MALAVDISVLGDKALIRQLKKLEGRIQKKVVRQALRASATRLKKHIINKIGGGFFKEPTGRLLAGMIATNVRAGKRSTKVVEQTLSLPERSVMGIDPSDEEYYPAFVEYGFTRRTKSGGTLTVPPKSFIRAATFENKNDEFRRIGADIGKNIEREAKRAK